MVSFNNFQNAVDNKLHAHTNQKESHQAEMASIPFPNQPHNRTRTAQAAPQNDSNQKKISGGATSRTQSAKVELWRTVDAELMIIAIVPGPAVLGIAKGTKAIFALGSSSSSSDLLFASGESVALCCGKSMRNQ